MPTKPANVEEWASDAVYTNGPYAGQDTKVTIPPSVAAEGAIPGDDDPMAAEHFNDYFSRMSRLVRWLYLGSSAGEADAHVLESDTDGRLNLHLLTVHPKTAGIVEALDVLIDQAGAQSGVAIRNETAFSEALYVTNTGASTANAIDAGGGDNAYAILAHPAGGMSGGGLFASASVGWTAITGQGADGEYAIRGLGTNTGFGGRFTAGANATHALEADGVTNGTGIFAYGGTASGAGVYGEARDASSPALYGASKSTANTSGVGVLGEGRGDGSGGRFYNTTGDGYALAITGTIGTRAPLFIGSRTSDPANTSQGQVNVRSDEIGAGGYHFKIYSGEWRGLWSTRNGFCYLDVDGNTTSTTTSIAMVPASAFSSLNTPKKVGKVAVKFSGEIGRTGTCTITIDLVDVTSGVIFATANAPLYQSGAGVYERSHTLESTYTLPAAGARTWRVDMTRTGGGGADVVRCRNTHLSVSGVYD